MSRVSKFLRIPFANAGDRSSVPDTSATGALNMTTGYGPLYQGNQSTDPTALYIERDLFNGLLYTLSQAVQVLQSFGGAAEWISAADNGGTAYPYAKGARVLYSDGWVYESLIDANTSTPSLTSASWARMNAIDSQVPTGSVHQFAHNPGTLAGYLYCDGRAVSRTDYARLFAAIGTQYGAGDGSTTFNVPDFRGMFLRGFSDGQTTWDPSRVFATRQASANKSHAHEVGTASAGGHTHPFTVVAYNTDSGGVGALTGGANSGSWDGEFDGTTGYSGAHSHPATCSPVGDVESRPVNFPVYFYVKA